jgi:type IV secretory pathway VirB10-like protein
MLAVYRGPFDEFVGRRDALAKQLRADKRRDDAALVKALRKPSRMAWVLNRVVAEDPESLSGLNAAIAEAQSAVDLRAAFEGVKAAVRAVAAAGARIAVRAEHPLEPNAIAAAINAVISDASAFAEFRSGRLVDIPEGGGLDLLITLRPPPPPAPAPAPAPEPATRPAPPEIEPPKEDPRSALAAAARAELRRAEELLAAAREDAEQASGSARAAQARLDAAEQALLDAKSEVEARRQDSERARQRAESSAASLVAAQRACDSARARTAAFE